MALVARPHPPALPHGAIREVLPGIHFVTGTVRMTTPPIGFSRNMTIVREGERLVLVNCVRLDEAGLAALDALGKVTDDIGRRRTFNTAIAAVMELLNALSKTRNVRPWTAA